LTIADFAISSTLVTAQVLVEQDLSKYPKVTEYLEKCKKEITDFKEITEEGLLGFKQYFDEVRKIAQ